MNTRIKLLLCLVLTLLLCSVFPILALAEDDVSSAAGTVSESGTVSVPADPLIPPDPSVSDAEETKGLLAGIKEDMGDIIKGIQDTGHYLNPANWMDSLQGWVLNQAVSVINCLTSFLSVALSQEFFSNGYVSELLDFFKWLAGIILGVSVVKSLAGEAGSIRNGKINHLPDMVFSIIKGFCLILFAQPAVMYMNYWTSWLIDTLSNVPGGGFTLNGGGVEGLGYHTIVNIIIYIVLLVCTVKVIWMALKRYVVLMLQIVLGYLYAFDAAGGDREALGEWLRDVISGCITFALQMTMYQVGLKMLCGGLNAGTGLNSSTLVGFIFIVSVTAIPSILRRYGYSYQKAPGHGGQIAHMAMQAGYMLSAIL